MKKRPAEGSSATGKQKAQVISRTLEMIDGVLKDYREPQRKGTAKGEAIGFPTKKMKAAWLMTLYPYCLKLKEIAQLAGVSEGVLRVWCNRDDFILKWEEISKTYGESIAERIRSALHEQIIGKLTSSGKGHPTRKDISTEKDMLVLRSRLTNSTRKKWESEGIKIIELDDGPDRRSMQFVDLKAEEIHRLMEDLLFFNEVIQEQVLQMLEENAHIEGFDMAWYNLLEARYFWEDTSPYRMRKWEIRRLPTTKMAIEKVIYLLTDPRERKRLGEDRCKELATLLKDKINETLDILAM